MPKLYKFSKCVTRTGDGMKDNGWAYIKCGKSAKSPIERVIHGANPNKGQAEIKQNVLNIRTKTKDINENKGMSMNFKDRILEENFQERLDRTWDATKNFASKNPMISSVLGGAALGGLYNLATGGADELQAERDAAVKNIPELQREALASEKMVDEDKLREYYNNYLNATDQETGFGGNWRDAFRWLPFTNNDNEALKVVNSLGTIDERFGTGENLGKIDGYKINPNIDFEANKVAYQKHLMQGLPESKEALDNLTKDKSELQNEIKSIENAAQHATRDSYLKAAGVGAGLTAAGTFAKRKLDERNKNQ